MNTKISVFHFVCLVGLVLVATAAYAESDVAATENGAQSLITDDQIRAYEQAAMSNGLACLYTTSRQNEEEFQRCLDLASRASDGRGLQVESY